MVAFFLGVATPLFRLRLVRRKQHHCFFGQGGCQVGFRRRFYRRDEAGGYPDGGRGDELIAEHARWAVREIEVRLAGRGDEGLRVP